MDVSPHADKRHFRKHFFGLSPWLMLGVFLVLGISVVALAFRNVHKERGHIVQSYFDRAEALIWTIESGARAGRGYRGAQIMPQMLLEETARQPGIKFMAIVDRKGNILAHSDPAAATLPVPRDSLPAEFPENITEYAENNMGNEDAYILFRRFSPLSRAHEATLNHHGRHFGAGRQIPGAAPNSDNDIKKRDQESFIFIGFDRKPFEAALASDHANNLLSAMLVGALGFAGFISLFWAHSHREFRRRLKDTQTMASEVVRSLPLGLISSDPGGNVLMCNAAAREMFRAAEDDMNGKPVSCLAGLDWKYICALLASNEKVTDQEMSLASPAGKSLTVSVSASKMRGEDGFFLGSLFIINDVTEMRRLQSEAQRNERLAALGSLAAGVAHEIRNPLSSIKGLATYIAGKIKGGSPEEEASRTMIVEVNRLNRVVSELLDFARPGDITLSATDIDEVLRRALRLADADIKTAGIHVSYDLPGNLPPIPANGERLTQAFLNIFLNAVQAMRPEGLLQVQAERLSEEELAIRVTDNGEGICKDVLASIFTPYFTTKPQGTGLGLPIAHQIIANHGGRITVASEPGKGTTFTVVLPLKRI